MARVWVQLHDGKVTVVHPGGYIAFTPQEWEDLKRAGDAALHGEEPRRKAAVPGWVAATSRTVLAIVAGSVLVIFFQVIVYLLTHQA